MWFQSESDIWHGQYCGNPKRSKKEVIDFVTGKKAYGGVNDLGTNYISVEQRPFAKNVNTDGMCQTFQKKFQ